MLYSADFETTAAVQARLEGETRVWLSSICTVEDEPKVLANHHNIEDFINYCGDNLEDGDIVFFHNLKFDGAFILDWCFSQDWHKAVIHKTVRKKKIALPRIEATINQLGTFYSITLRYEIDGTTKEIKIWNSLLKIPLKVSEIPEAYGFAEQVTKGDIDYNAFREKGYQPTAEEVDYCDRDVIIVAKALNQHFSEGHDKMTIGSDALEDFKRRIGFSKFKRDFPEINASTYLHIFKPSYKGGMCWLKPSMANKLIEKLGCYDVNSQHPASMKLCPMPYSNEFEVIGGEPVIEEECETFIPGLRYKPDTSPLFIAGIDIYNFECKKDRPPVLQFENSTKYIEHGTQVEHMYIVVSSVMWDLIKECYDIENYEFNFHCLFKRKATGMFDDFIDHWMDVKSNSYGGQRQISKLILNNLYGKFGQHFEKPAKSPKYDGERIRYITDHHKYYPGDIDKETGDLVRPLNPNTLDELTAPFIPIAIFTCDYSRKRLVDAIIANWDRFIYCDTDSIYLTGWEQAEGIEIDKRDPVTGKKFGKIGAWDKECEAVDGWFIKAKCYTYKDVKKDCRTYKCAGLPEAAKEYITFEQFRVGVTFIGEECYKDDLEKYKKRYENLIILPKGKLQPRIIKGGVILEEVPFTIG